ncbi:MAG TPA: S-layer homology domain-containing protein [Syntrophomonadaceae bacterium]|nr:S-layer homology domain-containing protein [Syntrophomonadaceae bacterium]
MGKKLIAILLLLLIIVFSLNIPVIAAGTLNLSTSGASAGDTVTAYGVSAADTWVAIKVLDSSGSIVFYEEVKAGADGEYSCAIKVPSTTSGKTLKVVAGYGSNVASAEITVSGHTNTHSSNSGDNNSATPLQPVSSTTGSAMVNPAAGGTVSFGNDVTLHIPANALQGSGSVQVTIQKVDTPPAAPTGFMLMGTIYQFTVNGQEHYNFNRPVTLTFTFDPSKLAPGETPAVYYYDETSRQWVNIGGIMSGNTITVTVDHFTKFAVIVKQSPCPAQKPAVALTDISGHWAEANINALVGMGVISGYPDGTYKPDNTITRAEFVTVLVKAFKLAQMSGHLFNDTAGHWAKDSIATAVVNNIVNGYDADKFGPDDMVTREQMAVMIVKVVKLAGTSEKTDFADNADISPWAQSNVVSVVKAGIMKGYPNNTFRPQTSATRAEAMTVILNSIGSSGEK